MIKMKIKNKFAFSLGLTLMLVYLGLFGLGWLNEGVGGDFLLGYISLPGALLGVPLQELFLGVLAKLLFPVVWLISPLRLPFSKFLDFEFWYLIFVSFSYFIYGYGIGRILALFTGKISRMMKSDLVSPQVDSLTKSGVLGVGAQKESGLDLSESQDFNISTSTVKKNNFFKFLAIGLSVGAFLTIGLYKIIATF